MHAAVNGTARPESRDGAEGLPSALRTPALLTTLERGPHGSSHFPETAGANGLPRWIVSLLRTPLTLKLAGANAFLLVATATLAIIVRNRELTTAPVVIVVSSAFLLALLVNMVLVNLAVRPMTMLENTVDTIWRGDLSARVPPSLLADRNVARVGRMFNILLDGLLADRARTRKLALELINAGDRERAAMSRELHDSTAQSLAALVMQLSVLAQDAESAPVGTLKNRLAGAKDLATATLEEVRLLAHAMHPRVLDDLGLVAAVRRLVRESTALAASSNGVKVVVVAADGIDEEIPAAQASVLYRVAQEAVRNALRHAAASNIEIRIWTEGESASLEVSDDGRGFDPDAARTDHGGIGLFTMRERVALVDGELQVESTARGGTTVLATVPLRATTGVL